MINGLDEKQVLAEYIVEELQNEFKQIHYSGNLAATIIIEETEDGWRVEIPAQVYDLKFYNQYKAIWPKGTNSYANEVDITGGFSGKHKGYVDRCIANAISKWQQFFQLTVKVR